MSLRGSESPKFGLVVLGLVVAYISPDVAPNAGVGVVGSPWLLSLPGAASLSAGGMYPSISGGVYIVF